MKANLSTGAIAEQGFSRKTGRDGDATRMDTTRIDTTRIKREKNRLEPFFVVGASRSGTTMLRLMLNRHPALAIPPESHFVIPLLQKLPTAGVLTTAQVKKAARIITGNSRFVSWNATAEELSSAFLNYPDPTLDKLIDTAFRIEITQSGKPRWGDKTPAYASIISELHELFPEARFIHITRDGRDVSNSLRKVAWFGWTEYERARHWARTVMTAEAGGKRVGPSRYIRVSYEDLVLNPKPSLERLCCFLGIPMHDSMPSFYEDALDHIAEPERRSGNHMKVGRKPQKTDIARWRRESALLRVLLFEAIAGRAMDHLKIDRHFRGASRCLAAVVCFVYTPIGSTISGIHQIFEMLPTSMKSFFRTQSILRWVKQTVIRC